MCKDKLINKKYEAELEFPEGVEVKLFSGRMTTHVYMNLPKYRQMVFLLQNNTNIKKAGLATPFTIAIKCTLSVSCNIMIMVWRHDYGMESCNTMIMVWRQGLFNLCTQALIFFTYPS